MRRTKAGIAAAGVLVLIAIAVAAGRVGFLQADAPPASQQARPAPELVGISGWVNSPPLTLAGLRGKVVLIDFWTYTCINCVRTFPHLRALYATYHRAGLEVVGVHSPEFAFEKEEQNVREAVRRHRLRYPVALDSEMRTWRAFGNSYWPRVYLIDAEGVIRFDHIGEGGEARIQSVVRALLADAGAALPAPVSLGGTGPSANITPEIYAGYERGGDQGSLGNDEGYAPQRVVDYRRPAEAQIDGAGTSGTFFLEGPWRAEREYVEADADGARVELPFRASNVYLVGAPAGPGPGLRVILDGAAVPVGARGADAGNGTVRVTRSDLFHVLAFDRAETHTLTLIAGRGFRLYTFTFG